MQVLDPSIRMLGGFPNKDKWIPVKTNLVHVEKQDKLDPIVSIALGTRLFGQKFSEIKDKDKNTVLETVRRYHSTKKDGVAYGEKVMELHEASRKK